MTLLCAGARHRNGLRICTAPSGTSDLWLGKWGVQSGRVRPSLPVRGVTFLLGNDIAGGKVMRVLEVQERPEILQPDVLAQDVPEVFPVCAVTRSQARSQNEAVDLLDTLFATVVWPACVTTSVFSGYC